MKGRTAVLTICSLLITGCASNVGPVALPVAPARPPVTLCEPAQNAVGGVGSVFRKLSEKDRMQWYVCELYARANANLRKSNEWYNKTEWRDLPLLGAAATIAGLLLFGKRGADGELVDSAQEGVAIAGFGAASLVAFANYLSPEKARDVLRKGARGHFCMATQGEVLLVVWDDVKSDEKVGLASGLSGKLSALKGEIDKQMALAEDARGASLPEAQVIYARGVGALALYNRQRQWLDVSSIHLGETAWSFGSALLEQSDRDAVDVGQLVRSITEQAGSIAAFEQQSANMPGGEEAGTGGAPAAPPARIDAISAEVRTDLIALLADLPNVEALVRGFDNCAATALVGGSPKATLIQSLELE